jgi:hypothetical protein
MESQSCSGTTITNALPFRRMHNGPTRKLPGPPDTLYSSNFGSLFPNYYLISLPRSQSDKIPGPVTPLAVVSLPKTTRINLAANPPIPTF